MSDRRFNGFPSPQTNYYRIPNEWTDITHDITSLAVLKVVEYVLRHTWGYNQETRRISIDEFANGRKRKDGGRIDRGTGLSAGSISTGLRAAVDMGYLRMEEDRTDAGRIRRFYSLAMRREDGENSLSKSEGQGSEIGNQGLESGGPSLEIGDRSKTDNSITDNLQKDNSLSEVETSDGENEDLPNDEKRREPSSFDFKVADVVRRTAGSVGRSKKRFDRRRWADVVRLMRTVDGFSKERIKEAVLWNARHVGEPYVPEVFCTSSLREKFLRLLSAMERDGKKKLGNGNGRQTTAQNMYDLENCDENGQPRIYVDSGGNSFPGSLVRKVRRRLSDRFGAGLPTIEQVNEVLSELGERKGALTVSVVGRIG